jgi:membrane protein required for beta-lactamase induction
LIIGVVVGVVVAVLLLVLVIVVICWKKNKINKHNNNVINGVKANPAAATNYNAAAGYQEEEHIVNPINSGGYNSTVDSHGI